MVSIDDLQKSYMGFSNRGAPDPDPDPDLAGYPVNFVDPVQIRIRPDPETVDPVEIRIRPDPESGRIQRPDPESGRGRIQNVWIRPWYLDPA